MRRDFILERVTGIEPVYSDWQPDVLTIVLYPHSLILTMFYYLVAQVGVEPTCP
jgi:hypothetical protein